MTIATATTREMRQRQRRRQGHDQGRHQCRRGSGSAKGSAGSGVAAAASGVVPLSGGVEFEVSLIWGQRWRGAEVLARLVLEAWGSSEDPEKADNVLDLGQDRL